MPAVSAPCKVLVTGANGYIGAWVVRQLLEKGYSVRGAVRTPKKGEYLKSLFETYGQKFELAIVDDITKVIPLSFPFQIIIWTYPLQAGAFDEAVGGIDLVQHIASPVHYNAVEPDGKYFSAHVVARTHVLHQKLLFRR